LTKFQLEDSPRAPSGGGFPLLSSQALQSLQSQQ